MTRVENSPKKFQINNDQVEKYAAGAERTVDDISSFAIGQLVTICVKVAKVGVFKKKKKEKALEEARLHSRRLHVPMPGCSLGGRYWKT